MTIVILASYDYSLTNFRGPLIREMVRRGHEVIACAPRQHEEAVQEVLKLGVAYQAVPMARTGLNPFRDLRTLVSLARFFRRIRPDLLLSYTIKPVIYGSLAARWAGVPAVYALITGQGYTFRPGGFLKRGLNGLVRRLYRMALGGCRRVFFQNPDDRAVFVQGGLVSEGQAVEIHGSGVDLEHFSYAPPPEGPPVFLLAGRMLADKGVREYVEAARRLKERHPEVRFRLLGPADENRASLRLSEIRGWVERGIVEYQPFTRDVRPAFREASVYVLPSYGEGMPRTVLEAMATGRPIVTTDVPGCRQTVEPGENGLLVPVRDVEALAGAMEFFIRHPDQIGPMGRKSRRRAEEKSDVRRVNAVILEAMGLQEGSAA